MLDAKRVFVQEWELSQKRQSEAAVQEHQCADGNAEGIEDWVDVAGYEGRYQVSNLGRIKSLARLRLGKRGCSVAVKEQIMSLNTKKDTGRTKPYVEVRLRNGGPRTERCKAFLVHRLVAAAFIRPLEPGEQVDHINGIHGDNRAVNLRIMRRVEHGRIHPVVLNPLPRDPFTGRLMRRENS